MNYDHHCEYDVMCVCTCVRVCVCVFVFVYIHTHRLVHARSLTDSLTHSLSLSHKGGVWEYLVEGVQDHLSTRVFILAVTVQYPK